MDYQKRVKSDDVEMVDGDDDKEDGPEFKPKSDDDEGEEDEANEDEDEDEEERGRKG